MDLIKVLKNGTQNAISHCIILHLPVIGFSQEVHLFANKSPKHSAQYGLSSLEVNLCPAKQESHLVQVKHSLCHGSFR